MSLLSLMRLPLVLTVMLLGVSACDDTLTGSPPIQVQTKQLARFDPTHYHALAVVVLVEPHLGPGQYGAPMGRDAVIRAVTDTAEKELAGSGYPVLSGKTLAPVLAHDDDPTQPDGVALAKYLGADLVMIIHVHVLYEAVFFSPDGLTYYAQRYDLTAETVDVATGTVDWVALARGDTRYGGGHLVELAALITRNIADLFPPKTLSADHLR